MTTIINGGFLAGKLGIASPLHREAAAVFVVASAEQKSVICFSYQCSEQRGKVEMPVEFWFEFASTYTYPAVMRIEQCAADFGVAIIWRSFLLGPIFKDQGWSDSPFNLFRAKGRYMWRDLERICKADDLPFRRPSVFPRNGLLPARIACRFSDAPWLPNFVRAVFRANFEEDLDIASPEVVLGCLSGMVDDPAGVLEAALTNESKAKLRNQNEAAVRIGVFGAPSFVVGSELFWGNDRLDSALVWAKKTQLP